MTVASRRGIRFAPASVMGIGRQVVKVPLFIIMIVAVTLFIIMAAVFTLILVLEYDEYLLGVVVFSYPVLLAMFVIAYDRWARFRAGMAAYRSRDGLLLALMRLRRKRRKPLGILQARSDWAAALKQVRESCDPPVIAVCEESLEKKLMAIEELTRFPEPESLGVGGITRWGLASFFVVVAGGLSSSCFLISGSGRFLGPALAAEGASLWVLTVIGLVLLLFTIFGTPIRGFLIRRWRRGSGSFIIGPGFLAEGNGRALTVADSLLMVDSNPKEVNTEIRVLLLGPKHRRRFRFNSVRDRAFVKLWQCWTHPEPRPELAG